MFLTLSTTAVPATELGFVLHKHPDRAHSFELAFGTAHVFYPEADEARCTVALLVEVDPIGLVRNRRGSGDGRTLAHYVNDRPYAASSLLSVALGDVFNTAMAGRCKARPELAERAWPLEVRLSALPCRGGEALVRKLFEPLGYTVDAEAQPLDEKLPWGPSRYFTVTLRATLPVAELLAHLYVLMPVLDDDKHYWVGDDEVEKLIRRGDGWLAEHPERELITRRYLRHQRSLVRDALDQLLAEELPRAEALDAQRAEELELLERKVGLNEQRIAAVVAAIRESGARRVLDLGCGEGRLLRTLFKDRAITELVGVDVSPRALEIARDRLKLERLSESERSRVKLWHGSLVYRDQRLAGFDAAAIVEVIEHLDAPRLWAFERVVFEHARPQTVVVTTPNVEFNVKLEGLAPGKLRHDDHRFEWTRAEFSVWASGVAARFGYGVRFSAVGDEDPIVGAPTQLAVFSR